MVKVRILLFLLLIGASTSAQKFTSVQDWPMPQGDVRGLVKPAFKLVPKFEKVSLGNEVHVYLRFEVIFSTPSNPVAPYAFRYLYQGKEYTDQDIGQDPFKAIKLARAVFSVRVQGDNNYNKQINFNTVMGKVDLGIFSKDVDINQFAAHVQALYEVSYYSTEVIEKAIQNFRVNNTKKIPTPANTNQTGTNGGNKNSNNTNNGGVANNPRPSIKDPANSLIKPTAPVKDSFWSNRTSPKTTEIGKVIPEQPSHKDLPSFVRTTDGGYYYKGNDGKFRQVTTEQYQQLKQASATRAQVKKPDQRRITAPEASIAIDKMFSDAKAQNDAINQKIAATSQMWQQNFYYAEAIRNGKENLAALSTMSGNYTSVAALEADFNQQYSAIRAEVNNLESARNAKLANAVNGNFNGSSTEQAIGQGMQLIGGLVNSAKADKERKEAQAALKAERDRQLAAIAAAKKKATLDLRNQLVRSFPDGGTPLTAHKVTLPEVYLFAYITDKAAFNNDIAAVAVSNVFPVAQYSDGTFPYKTTVTNKLKGFASGGVVLIGYYADKQSAEQMRNSFINLALKSELSVKQFALKALPGSANATSNGDFWETGTKPSNKQQKEKKTDFWNN